MKITEKIALSTTLILLTLAFTPPNATLAATSPSIGSEAPYAVVSSTYTNSLNAGLETAIHGDICYTTGSAIAPVSISGATIVSCPSATGTDQGLALADINTQANAITCTNLGTNVVLAGTYAPGCYTASGAMDIVLSTTVTLSGTGTYIFRSVGALTTGANSQVLLSGGAAARDVFWASGGAVHLGANAASSPTPTFVGNIIAPAGITMGHFANLLGRALAYGGTVTTDSNTITVPPPPATLKVTKTVVNNSGRNKTVSDFTLSVNGSTVISDAINTFPPGAYVVSENSDPTYTATFSGACDAGGNVSLTPGDNKTCIITNDDIAPVVPPATLKVTKTVVNNSGRNKTVSDFTLSVNGSTVISDAINTFPPGAYVVSEISDPTYTATFSGACDAGGNVSLTPGDNKTCIITNDDIAPVVPPPPVPPLISVIKVPSPLNLPAGPGSVIYTYTLHNIGTVPATDITMSDDSCSPVALISGDTNNNTILDITETWIYTCSATLAATHTNTVIATGQANGLSATDTASTTVVVGVPVVPPLIHVTKVPSPLTLASGGGAVTYTETITNPGTATLNNINLTDDKCGPVIYVSGDANGNSLLESAESWVFTCHTIIIQSTTNTATASGDANGLTATDGASATVLVAAPIPAVPSSALTGWLTVVKMVVNDNGGAKTVANFPLFVNGTPVLSGDTNAFNASPQMYHVTETGNAQYARSFSGDCNVNGDVLLNHGDRKICIVTNNDIGAVAVVAPVPPLIDVVKVPNPLALPTGPGAVIYTYTLKNIGTVPVTNITMIGDTCSPIILSSGDTNGDAKLQVNETWIYRCFTILAKTHTNTVTTVGWANGISTTDIASATVVVGAPVIPPLIHVTKVPNPLALRAGGGLVTYTEKITNPGTVALSNVTLTDDKCAPMKLISGDTNGDSKLDPSETWTYTCSSNLAITTTNTAIASGSANGMTVRDIAIATVVVASRAVPALPKTGFDPFSRSLSFLAFAAAIVAVSLLFYAIQRKIIA